MMHVAYVWHNPMERAELEATIRREEPGWMLTCFEHRELEGLHGLHQLVGGAFDIVMLHLSLPPCFAIKLAELWHREHGRTRIVLVSRTQADKRALSTLFAEHIHPDSDASRVTEKIRTATSKPVVYLSLSALQRAIVRIFNSDDVLPAQYRHHFGELYRGAFTFEDYRRFAEKCLVEGPQHSEVFISHSSIDRELAEELKESLRRRGITSFVAARDIEGGDVWATTIREALLGCKEILVVITPHAIGRPWVMIEAGAGWALGKRLTPCVAFTDLAQLPEPLAKSQTRAIVTRAQRGKLVQEVAGRLRPGPRKRAGA
jgi:DNA-binding NarL/FixJ family response regulator